MNLLIESGQKVSVVSKDYGLNDNMIRLWRREFADSKKPSFTGNGNPSLTKEEKRISELKKELENT